MAQFDQLGVGRLHTEKREQTMTQSEKFPDFEAYLQDLLHRSRTSLSQIENQETEAALDRLSQVGERNQIDPAPQEEPSMHRCLLLSRLSGIA
jgi:hypothetical protein